MADDRCRNNGCTGAGVLDMLRFLSCVVDQVAEVKHELTCKVNLEATSELNSSSIQGLDGTPDPDALIWDSAGVTLPVTLQGQSYSINAYDIATFLRENKC